MAKPTLDHPPFPRLEWDEFFWMGEVELQSWSGFRVREDDDEPDDLDPEFDRGPCLVLHPEGQQAQGPPLPEQAEAFRFLLEHEEAVAGAVLQAIFAKYQEWRQIALDDDFRDDFDDEDEVDPMPEIDRPESLQTLIGLSNVHVLDVAADGVAYIGFEFGCSWDEEHGLGVMTHRGRVVEVGGADTSFLEWIAEQDARGSR